MKTAQELYTSLCQSYTEKSGREIAEYSDIAVRLYAFAAELESLYCYLDWSRAQCFPQTASGSYLDLFGEMRCIFRKAARAAEGEVSFSRSSGAGTLRVPSGTVLLSKSGLHFRTTQEAVFAEGELTASSSAVCCEVGTQGNVTAGTVVCFSAYPQGVTACRNLTAFSGGCDAETDESYRARLLADYKSSAGLPNAAFYESFVMAYDDVAACKVIPRMNGIGTVGIAVELCGGESDAARLNEIAAALQRVREVATDVTVFAPERVNVSYSIALTPAAGVSFSEASLAAEAAIRAYFDGNLLGKTVYLTKLGALIEATGLVETYHFDESCRDCAVTQTQRLWLEELTLTEGETE